MEKLFTCSNKECSYYINEGEENYLATLLDSQGGVWCPCCHSKMIKEG